MAVDHIFASFLRWNREQGLALARDSDLLDLTPVGDDPPQRYLAEYRCRGLVRDADGTIREADRFLVGIYFPDEYLNRADPYKVLTWLEPENIFQSNIRPPLICLQLLAPGRDLVSLCHDLFELITWQLYAADDPLNHSAAEWARHNRQRLPVDGRPLKRRSIDLCVEEEKAAG